MTTAFFTQAKEKVALATTADHEKRYQDAFELYCEALQHFQVCAGGRGGGVRLACAAG